MSDQWGPITAHDGRSHPKGLRRGQIVRGFYRDGTSDVWPAFTRPVPLGVCGGWLWCEDARWPITSPKDIIAYQAKRPRALQQMIDAAAALDRPREAVVA